MTETQQHLTANFFATIDGFAWLAHAGEPHDDWIVVSDAAEGFDEWNPKKLSTWSPRTHELEQQALLTLSDNTIDEIFALVGARIDFPVRSGLQAYFDRRPVTNESTLINADLGLWPEIVEAIQRDVAWAGVEHVLGAKGFFTQLLAYYRAGRWVCSWSGDYPAGKAVVL